MQKATTQHIINKFLSRRGTPAANRLVNKVLRGAGKRLKAQTAEVVHREVFEEFDCMSCGNCCKSIPPIVSGRDAKRITSHLGVSREEFEKEYLVTDEDGDRVINSSPCPFLGKDNHCAIYEVRPAACRQYPHSDDGQFLKNLSLHKRNAKYCPALFEIIVRLEKHI